MTRHIKLFPVVLLGLNASIAAATFDWQATLDAYGRSQNPPLNAIVTTPVSDGPRLNLGTVQLTISDPGWSVDVVAQAGDYVDRNSAAEPSWAKPIHTARLTAWLTPSVSVEAGVLPSHIGLESARNASNWTMSRSWVAEFSPFFETGVALGVTDPNWGNAKILVIDGWQQINNTNGELAWGTQLTLTPHPATTLGLNTYFGNEGAIGASRIDRRFLDLTWVQSLSDTWKMSAAWDWGNQSGGTAPNWYGGSVISRWAISSNQAIAGRLEWFQDPHGAVVPNGATMVSSSVNWDIQATPEVLTRLEARWDNVDGIQTFTSLVGVSWGIGGRIK